MTTTTTSKVDRVSHNAMVTRQRSYEAAFSTALISR
jgi:hypothetical protein